MNKKLALKKSIKKWKKILSGTGTDMGIANCALCILYHGKDCEGCPVAEAVEDDCCDGTPYQEWSIHQDEMHGTEAGGVIYCDECRRLATEEIVFLKSLENRLRT